MYRYNTTKAPRSAGRPSTRSARGSSTRRRSGGGSSRGSGGGGGGGGLKRKFEAAAQRPAKKWAQVLRSPASNISFQVLKWVPFSDLTEEERLDLEAKQEKEIRLKIQQQPKEEQHTKSQDDGEGEEVYLGAQDSEHVEAPPSNNPIEYDGDVTMSEQVTVTPKIPMESAAFSGEEEGSKKLRTTFEGAPTGQSNMTVADPQYQAPTISTSAQPSQD